MPQATEPLNWQNIKKNKVEGCRNERERGDGEREREIIYAGKTFCAEIR